MQKKVYRERERKPQQWKINVRKESVASGKSFVNSLGRQRPERAVKPHKCKFKCYEKIKEGQRNRLFNSFRTLSHSQQTAYLYACRTKKETKVENSKRKFFNVWSLPAEEAAAEQRIKVCQGAIQSIFDVSYGRLNNLDKTFKEGENRGTKKENFRNQPMISAIEDHIKSVPKHKSHYNRKKCPFKMYIARDGIKNIADMHDLYMSLHLNEPLLHCKYSLYRSVFRTYKIGFLVNSTDECGICLKAKSEQKTNTKRHKRHLMHAKTARIEHKKDVEETDEKTFVGERDLKSVTDIPKLPHGEMFYSRTLSCYTSIIHDSKKKQAHLFNWTETEASRGTNEMIQVRADFVKAQQNEDGERKYDDYIFWEDNCSGQNKSRYNPVADLFLVQNGYANSISTKFFKTGHSFMSPDQVSGTINRHLSKLKIIETPSRAFEEMKKSKKRMPFESNRMNPNEWKDWKKMQEDCTQVLTRKAFLPDGTRVEPKFLNAQQWKVSRDKPWSIFLKHTFSELEPWKELKVKKGSRTPELANYELQRTYEHGRMINKKKFLDLQKMCPMLHSNESKEFYKSLQHDGVMSDAQSEVDEDEDTDDEFWKSTDQWLPEVEQKTLSELEDDSIFFTFFCYLVSS
jgi:hypothetical protein